MNEVGPSDAPPGDLIGAVLGPYRIVGKLGAGGMGSVYLAEHQILGRRAAIKILLPDLSRRSEAVARFFNEARTLAKLKHPGLVEVYDFGTDDRGDAYLVMELVDGESLESLLRREGPLAPAKAVAIARQIAAALEVAHASSVVHRDLKPENVLLAVGPDGQLRAKLVDFGVAKALDLGPGTTRTRTGTIVGTPLYMSPEQCRGNMPVDHRADIYALGCLLYAMVCGRPPFVSDSPGELIAAHIHESPGRPGARVAGLPEALEQAIMTALAKAPEERFATMAVFAAALAGVTGLSDAAPVPGAIAQAAPAGTLASATVAALPASGRALPRRARWGRRALVGGAVALAASTAAWVMWRPRPIVLEPTPTLSTPRALSGAEAFAASDVDANGRGDGLAVWAGRGASDAEVAVFASRLSPAGEWSPPERVQVMEGKSVDSLRAGLDRAGAAFAAWQVETPSGRRLRVARGAVGAAWETVDVTPTAEVSRSVRLAVGSGGTAAVTWHEDIGDGKGVFARVFAPGRGWGERERVDTGSPPAASEAAVAVAGEGSVVVIWQQGLTAGAGLWARRRSASGPWEPAVRISREDRWGRVTWPKLVGNERGDALATWEEAADGGGQGWANGFVAGRGWGQPFALGAPSKAGVSPVPAIARDGAGAAIFQSEDATSLLVRVIRQGRWSSPVVVARAEPKALIYPYLAIDETGSLAAVWCLKRGGDVDAWLAFGRAETGFGPARRLGTGYGKAHVPHLAAAGPRRGLVVWTQPGADGGPRLPWAATF